MQRVEEAGILARLGLSAVILVAILVALLAAGILYQRAGVARHRRHFTPPGVRIDVGHHLHVICRGHGGPVVVLESGIAASSLSWALVQPAVAAFTRVCAYDRAGLGWSDPPSQPCTFDRIIDDLSGVLTRVVPDEPYVLVGHSFGSFVVRAYAMRHPHRVAGLVLVDPAVEWLTLTPQRVRLIRGAQLLSRIGALLAHVGVVRACLALLTGGAPRAPREFVRVFGPTTSRTLARLVGEVRKLPPELYPVVQELWCEPKCFHAMREYLSVLIRDTAAIAHVTVPREIPVTVISSADQPPQQIAEHRQLAAASVHGQHLTAARGAHWVQLDDPDVIVNAIRELVMSRRKSL